MSHITTRTVNRFYSLGKGFSTKRKAYLNIAKRNLRVLAEEAEKNGPGNCYAGHPCEVCALLVDDPLKRECRACEMYPYSILFPYPCKNSLHHPLHLQLNPDSEYNRTEARKERGFCNDCRWDWLKKEADRIEAEDAAEQSNKANEREEEKSE